MRAEGFVKLQIKPNIEYIRKKINKQQLSKNPPY